VTDHLNDPLGFRDFALFFLVIEFLNMRDALRP
jgi:hypothetical protein